MKNTQVRRKYRLPLTVLLAAAALPALTSAEPAGPEGTEFISRFVGPHTVAVARIDFAGIDLEGVKSYLVRETGADEQMLSRAVAQFEQFRSRLTGAGTGEIYVVLSLLDLPEKAPVLVVPLKESPDGQALADLKKMLQEVHYEWTFERTGGVLLCGTKPALTRVREMEPAGRPELRAAFRAAGDAPLQGVFIPTDDMRRVVKEIMPTLPKELGGGSSSALTRGLMWAAGSVELPPEPSFRARIQSRDASAARALDGMIAAGLKTLRQEVHLLKRTPALDEAIRMLTPKVRGAHLEVSVGAEDMAPVRKALAKAVTRARVRARRRLSLNNVKQILMGCMQYAHDHEGRWPPDLETLTQGYISASVLENPQSEIDGYAYVRPPVTSDKLRESAQKSRLIVVYGNYESWPTDSGVVAGYADGHAELRVSEHRFQEFLRRTKETFRKLKEEQEKQE